MEDSKLLAGALEHGSLFATQVSETPGYQWQMILGMKGIVADEGSLSSVRAAVRGSKRDNIVFDDPMNGKQFNGSTTRTVSLGYGSYC